MDRVSLVVLLASALGCGPLASSKPSPHERVPPPRETKNDPPPNVAGTPVRSRAGLTIAVSGPRVAPYQRSAAGLGGYHALVRLTNGGQAPIDVAKMKVQFAATRDGVSFPCQHHAVMPQREPTVLGPGESHVYERDIDCSTTLLGRYELSATVAFGSGAPESAGSFVVDVVGAQTSAPRPYPGRPALHVALVGETLVRGMPAAAWRSGAFAPVVVVTNASQSPMTLGALRVVLRMLDAHGREVACTNERGSRHVGASMVDVWGAAPLSLEPGRSHAVSVPMRCSVDGEGDFRVLGHVVLGDGPVEEGAPVGPLTVKVSRDPSLIVPQLMVP